MGEVYLGNRRTARVDSAADREVGQRRGVFILGTVEPRRVITEGSKRRVAWGRYRAWITDAWFSLDHRVLALFRVAFGTVLLFDTLRRIPFITLFYTDDGVLPSAQARTFYHGIAPVSVFLPLTSHGEVLAAFLLMALVYACYIVGYRTRIMQILAVVLTSGLYFRDPFFNNGGCRVLVILSTMSLLLPLGDRYSLDALRRSLRARPERSAAELNDGTARAPDPGPYRSILVFGLLIQISAIYFLNCVQKTDAAWGDGSAIHWILWQNTMDTTFAVFLRRHEPFWLSPMLTWGTLVFEGSAAIFVLSPYLRRWLRSIYVVLAVGLHIGIAAILTIGAFSYVMVALNTLLVPGFWLDEAAARLGRRLPAQTVRLDVSHPGALAVARILARLDVFARLHFVEAADLSVRPPLATGRPDGSWVEGAAAISAALRSTPAGWPFARWVVGPVLRGVALRAAQAPPRPARARSAARIAVGTTFRELGGALVILIMLGKIAHDNPWLKGRIPDAARDGLPAAVDAFLDCHGFAQRWALFADAQIWDGTVVVDAVTVSGRHLDPFTGKAPDFDAPHHGPWLQPQPIYDYFHDIRKKEYTVNREALGDYLENWQRLEGRPEGDRVVSYQIYWVSSRAPKPGHTKLRDEHKTLLASRG